MPEFITAPVGDNVEQAISVMRNGNGEPVTGNVLRRVCQWAGENACERACQFGEQTATGGEVAELTRSRDCADINLATALESLGLEADEVLMVGVTANEVGFVDRLDDYGGVINNPHGWRELRGFNAFFAREGEVEALGCRMADCADINFEFHDSDGNTVFGLEHGTRTNMFGSGKYAFEKDGQKMSFTEYALRQAIEHYGADPSTVRINLAAAIKGDNHHYTFVSAEKMEEVVPGWQADGFLNNVSNPDWQPGDPVNPEDQWAADTRGMIIRDIEQAMEALGIPAANFDKSNILDPNDSDGRHSSHKTSYLTGSPSTRDLYITYVK